jgi:ParB family chromosome partitioning protein
LEASVRHLFFPVQATDLKDSASARAVARRHEAWKAELPKDDTELWDWLMALDDTRRATLLAHCVSFGVNALYEKGDRYGGPGISVHGVQQRLAQADRLARAVGLDMVAAGWRPTVDNYLGRVTKPRILEAVREAKATMPPSSLTTSRSGRWRRKQSGCSTVPAGCRSRCVSRIVLLHPVLRRAWPRPCRHF